MAIIANDRSAARFITLEGGEGAGKSTQIKLLAAKLAAQNIKHITTREPGGTPEAENIRELILSGPKERWDPITELLLMFAARREHCRRVIWPAIENGQWVISDRFADSTMAYQGYAQGAGRAAVEQIQAVTLHQFVPDLTIILDIPVDTGAGRVKSRGAGNRLDTMDAAFHQAVRDGFLDIARREPDRCVVINADAAPEAVADTIWQVVNKKFLSLQKSA
jgi:dTMP kinase